MPDGATARTGASDIPFNMTPSAAVALSPPKGEGVWRDSLEPLRSAPWLDREPVGAQGVEKFREKTFKGSRQMPGFQYALGPTEIEQMIAYLKTVIPDQKPVPAGRGRGR